MACGRHPERRRLGVPLDVGRVPPRDSVWPREDGTLRLEDRLERVEAFYRSHGGPARFQLSPASRPAGLDHALDARGYRFSDETVVQTVAIGAVLNSTGDVLAVRLTETLEEAWLETWLRAEGHPPGREVYADILRRVPAPTIYALVQDGNRTVGVGRCVVERRWAGLFNVATIPEARRRGVARSILVAVATWAAGQGAERMYLQVTVQNQAGLSLYAGAGFVPLYSYHYRTLVQP